MTTRTATAVWDWMGAIQPQPLRRPRVTGNGKRAWAYPDRRDTAYRNTLRMLWLQAPPPPREFFRDDLEVRLWLSGSGRRGDIDNYAKAVLDALTGPVIGDDRMVTKLVVEIQEWGPGVQPMVRVRVRAWSSGSPARDSLHDASPDGDAGG